MEQKINIEKYENGMTKIVVIVANILQKWTFTTITTKNMHIYYDHYKIIGDHYETSDRQNFVFRPITLLH